MRSIYKIYISILLFLLLCGFTACSNDQADPASELSNTTMEDLQGEIQEEKSEGEETDEAVTDNGAASNVSSEDETSEENQEGISEQNPFEYTGYLDAHSRYSEANPEYDYDGDGMLDRIYKEYDSVKGSSSFYLHFGNGTKLLLTNEGVGLFYETEAADLTGDGKEEILFTQCSTSTKCENLYLSVFTWKDGAYELMENPYYRKFSVGKEEDGMLYVPLIMEKVDSAMVSIYQPDSEYLGYITTQIYTYDNNDVYDEMEHLYFEESAGGVQYYQSSEMTLADTGDNGRKALLIRSYLGDKWCGKSIVWKLEFLKGEWKITNVFQTDPVRVDVGTEFILDLDGDKTLETICYGTQSVEDHGYLYETPFLRINETEYNYQYLEEEFGVYISNCSLKGYYVLDIDTTDSYREIAILDEGPSDDPVTHFFRYSGKELAYCGAVTDFPDNPNFRAYGDGSIIAKKRLDILQTWWADATWKLNEKDALEEQRSDFYYPYQWWSAEGDTTNYAMGDLTLFQEPDLQSASVTVTKGETILLTATDNLNWIEITSEKGTMGWFYLDDQSMVTLPTGKCKVGDIVQYLNMAD